MAGKAVYVVQGGKVQEKRPRSDEKREQLRPFWESREEAATVAKAIKAKTRVYYFKIVDGKPKKSWSTTEMKPTEGLYTSKEQMEQYLQEVEDTVDYTITRGTISVFYSGKTTTITASDKRYSKLKQACVKEDTAAILDVINLKQKVKEVTGLKKGKVMVQGEEAPPDLAAKIVDTCLISADTIRKFNKRLKKNPSKSPHSNLLEFLKCHGCCFLDDGRFIAYKYVRDDFYDKYSGTVFYGPGTTATMPRKEVVEDPTVACQAGLHVGTWNYSSGSTRTVLAVVVDPYDVVSVPDDYGCQKMRCCKVHSVGIITSPIPKSTSVMSMKELEKMTTK